jgi:membrane glycosyltransferase
VRLVQAMERNPRAGILQTVPRLVNGTTPFARLQQFASRLYGPVFQAGLHFWQVDESNYWGHNAILRLAPFIEHCALPELPGHEPFGGRILSHDYVEAALMVRAGWGVWLAPDIAGSFEESPANLIDFAKRDRRWLQGNLQHSWLLAAEGLHATSRVHLAAGILSYLSSPLWLAFLSLSTLLVFRQRATGLSAIARDSLLPGFSASFGGEALGLFAGTMVLLFGPKLLAVFDLWGRDADIAGFGGWRRVLAGAGLEALWSTLFAPVLMLFHSKFFLWLLLGRSVAWITQRRGGDGAPDWREAILTHAWQTGVGLAWGAAALTLDPFFFVWLSPVLAGMALSIPLSIATAQPPEARSSGRPRLFVTPEEIAPPPVLSALTATLASGTRREPPPPEFAADLGLMQAALDPYMNAVHVTLLREKEGVEPDANRDRFGLLRERLIAEGPAALEARDKFALLMDANSMIRLHRELWSRPGTELADWWRRAIRQYNLFTPAPSTALYR